MPLFKKLHDDKKINGSDYYFLINQETEVIFKSLDYQKCLDKKARLDFIARARNTYTPNKFRIINLKNSSAMQTRNEHER
jgi:hypothetical protein